MAKEVPVDTIEEKYVRAMGPELGRLFAQFFNECAWLHVKWGEFVVLFGTNPERIDLLNNAAGGFFRIVQDALWENVLLHIARLTDRPNTTGKANLTLKRLPQLVSQELKLDVEKRLSEVEQKAKFARDWRNRHIAHSDLALSLREKNLIPLASASRKHVRDVLEAIVTLLNTVESHYRGAEVFYELTRPLKGAERLLYVLRDGLNAEEQRQKRFDEGKAWPEDFGGPAI